VTLLERAIALATKHHAGQKRKWGDPPADYLTHPLAVAVLVAEWDEDTSVYAKGALAAAVCHDVIEDTDCTKTELREAVGQYTARLVLNLSDVKASGRNRAQQKALDRDRLKSRCESTLLIKACDRLHNLSTVGDAPEGFRRLYLEESELLVEEVLAGSIPTGLLERLREVLRG